MSDVSRDEFDRLSNKVDRLARTTSSWLELIPAELVGIRSDMTDGFAQVNSRLDSVDSRLDSVDSRLDSVDSRLDSHGDLLREIVKQVST